MRPFLLIVLLASLLAPQRSALATAPVTAARLRLGVTADGIVRLTPADLAAAGIEPTAVDPRTFALSSLGQPVALRVTGEADGRFDGGDVIEFFGQQFRGPEMEQKYTDERVYWLDIGGERGLRIEDSDATPQGDLIPPADFATTVHAEKSTQWYTLHSLDFDTQDTWYWDRLQPQGASKGITRTFPYTVPHPAPGFPAELRLEKISRVWNDRVAPDHHTKIALNGLPLVDQTWDGHIRIVFTATVPAGILVSGVNTVTVAAFNLPNTTTDWVYVNFWEVDYRRLFRAWDDQLDFTVQAAGPQEYLADGWTTAQVAIWDISDPLRPQRLTGAAITSEAVGHAVRFRADRSPGARFWLQAESTFRPPASIRLRLPTGLRAPTGGADTVIVTSAVLRPAAERLADWHRANGRRALVADIQDVYDEFNEGIYHPKAVQTMMTWAQTQWSPPAPFYLVLFGDGHWNFKGYNPTDYPLLPNHIPPFLAWRDPWQGEVPVDALYGDVNGDGFAELAVGRLAVMTLAEANVVVDKIITYEDTFRVQPWQRRALFVADNTDDAGDFIASTEDIIRTTLPVNLTPQRIYLGQTHSDAISARAAISDALASGVWMVQYAGHGAPERWASEPIWHLTDVAGLSNAPFLPLVVTFNCLDGYFAHPGRTSIAETMQRQAGGGSIGAISPTGLGVIYDQHVFRKILMEVLFKDGERELGRVLLRTKQRYWETYARSNPFTAYLIHTVTLFGDPAMRLPQGMAWQYLPLTVKRQ